MTDILDDFPDLEVAAPPPPEETPPPDGPACEVCSAVIPWSGRGRKPKRCAEHKARTTAREGGSAPRRTSKQAAALEALHADLTKEFTLFGKGLARVLPTTGVTTVKVADKTAAALTRIAADNPRVFEALATATKIAPAIDLGEVAAQFGLALLVDLGRVDPDALLPRMFGVTETYHEIHDDDVDQPPTPSTGFPTVDVPPRFAEVG